MRRAASCPLIACVWLRRGVSNESECCAQVSLPKVTEGGRGVASTVFILEKFPSKLLQKSVRNIDLCAEPFVNLNFRSAIIDPTVTHNIETLSLSALKRRNARQTNTNRNYRIPTKPLCRSQAEHVPRRTHALLLPPSPQPSSFSEPSISPKTKTEPGSSTFSLSLSLSGQTPHHPEEGLEGLVGASPSQADTVSRCGEGSLRDGGVIYGDPAPSGSAGGSGASADQSKTAMVEKAVDGEETKLATEREPCAKH